jgi:lysophospholipase L1-like esterase
MYSNRTKTTAKRTVAVLAMGAWLATAASELMAESKHIVYIEASTVNNWKLDGFAARTGIEQYRFEVLREYEFDKSRVVEQALTGASRPDVVIVQECSTYFPGNLEVYKHQYRDWIVDIRKRGARPVIATVVPPARSSSWWQHGKDFIKERVLGRPSKYEQVLAFNEWLRSLGAELSVPVFDLEPIVRSNDADHHMRAEYDAGDGTHLNGVAYEHLDRALLDFLDHHISQSKGKP